MQYSGDRLVSYNGKTISYDAYGNPLNLSKGNQSLVWEGNRLVSSAISSFVTTYTYDAQGLRRTKTTSSGVTTEYIYEGTTLIGEIRDIEIFIYLYDESGLPIGMQYRHGTGDEWDIFWFEKNLQGDIVAVYMDDGTQILTYTYDAWGNATIEDAYVSDGIDLNIAYARKNPFRYRGYYYDETLQLYWLQTRYYDPAIGRFISPDNVNVLAATPGALTDKNLYAYCDNNLVMRVDYTGEFWENVFDVASLAFSIVDVCQNPDDVWAWVGLAFDIVDLLPIISGTGEVADVLRFANKADNVTDAAKAAKKLDAIKDASGNLSRGTHYVYYSKGMDGIIDYVGITNDFARRQAEWARKGRHIYQYIDNLDRKSARIIEQTVIEAFGMQKNGGRLVNKINSISNSRSFYKTVEAFK